ncbi:MAG TPA: fibronectin type III domain-containing protein [bacterium]|nr:fibronectin type III domain-containing protein [bacterium]
MRFHVRDKKWSFSGERAFALLLLGFLFLLPARSLAYSPYFAFPAPTPNAGVTYSVGGSVTLNVEVRDADNANAVDPSFTGPVTFSLVKTGTALVSDPQAIFKSGGQSVTGIGPLNFTAGTLAVSITFGAGNDSEQILLSNPTVTANNNYPVSITPGTSFKVKGLSVTLYAKDANGDNSPASYPPTSDLLVDTTNTAGLTQSSNQSVTIPYLTGPAGSASYAITGLSGGYAHGGADIFSNLQFNTLNLSSFPEAHARIIVNYDGTLSDYDNPGPGDTVYEGYVGNISGLTALDAVTYVSGPVTFPDFMTNGKVIVRVWAEPLADSSNTMFMVYKTAGSSLSALSSVIIPYSDKNNLPVRGFFDSAVTVVPDSSVTVLKYVIKNQYSAGVTSVDIQVPNSPAPSSQYWSIGSITASSGSATPIAQASAGGPGTILYSAPSTLAVNASVTLTINVTATDKTFSAWNFKILDAGTVDGITPPIDSSGAVIGTLGVPPAPTPFAASVTAYINSGGNNVDLSWSQVVTEGANGYIISRRSPSGSGAFAPLTVLGSNGILNFTDTTVSNNPNSYDYTIVTTNAIAQSPPVTVSNIIPYTNPGLATAVTALTGGTTIQLRWTAPVSVAGSYPVSGYQVFMGLSGAETLLATVTGASATSFTSPSLATSGTTYYYQVAAFDTQYPPSTAAPLSPHIGGLTNETAQASGEPPGNPPTGLAVVLTPGATPVLHVSWNAPDPAQMLTGPATAYQLQILPDGSGGSFVTIAAPTLSYNDSVVTAGHFYVFNVKAFDGAGVLSNVVGPVTGTVGPNTPTGLAQAGASAGVTLTWTAVANSAGETVTSYSIYRGVQGVGSPVSIASAVTTAAAAMTYVDPGPLLQGTNYVYQVSAVDQNAVEGGLSNAVTSALLPLAPQSFAVTVQQTGVSFNVNLAWDATVNSSNANVTNYNLSRGVTSTSLSFFASVTFSFAPPYTDPQPLSSAGTTLFYGIRGLDPGGLGTRPVTGIQLPPNPPTGVSAAPTTSNVTVNWTARPASEKVSQYTIYRINLAGPTTTVAGSAVSTVNSFTDSTGLSRGATYVYYVTATNPGGGPGIPGGESLASSSVTTGLTPLIPAGLIVSGINTSNDITVSWSSVTVTSQDPNATGVNLLVNTTNSSSTAVTTSLAASAVSQVLAGQSAGTTFFYWLQTVNPFGSGALTSPVSQLTYPGAPVLGPVALANDGVSRIFNWTAPVPSGSVTQYLIYREIQGSGNWINTASFPASVAGSPVTTTTAINPGQVYDYKIVAVNPTGLGPESNIRSFSSLPSAPVSVTAASGIGPSALQVDLAWADPNESAQGVTAYTVYRSSSNASTLSYTALVTVGSGTFNYSDTTVSDVTPYYYLITATNNVPQESFKSTVNAVAVTAYYQPNTPTSPAAVPATGSVTLTWTSAVATSYPVSFYAVSRTANGVTLAPVTVISPATVLNDSGLTNGVTYAYTIRTGDNQGHLSTATAPVTAVPLAPPGAPLSPNVSVGDTQLLLTWNPAVPGTLPIGAYNVYSVTAGPTTTYVGSAPATLNSYLVTGLSNSGVTYTYVVNAVDNSGVTTGVHAGNFTAFSGSPVSAKVNPASDLTLQAGNAQVILNWTDSVTISGAATVVSYRIVQSVGGAAFTTIGTQLPSGATESVTETSLSNGVSYAYFIVAASATTVSANSATVFGVPSAPPTAPATFLAVDGVDQVSLSWSPSPPQGSITISNYVLTQAVLPGAPSALATLGGAVTTYVDNNASNDGQTVVYAVAAVNSNGTLGAFSAPVTGFPYQAFAPTVTSHLSSSTGVTLNFTPAGSPSWPVTEFDILRTVVSTGVSVLIPGGPSSPVTDTTGVLGTLYSYSVVALDNKGHMSAASNAVTDGISNPPTAPATILLTAGSQEVLIDWPASAAVSGSLPVSFYILDVNGTPVTLPASQTWYLDSGLTDPATVTVSLTVIDASGQQSADHSVTLAGAAPAITDPNNINPPTGLTATALSTSSVQLVWTVPNDLGYPVTAFNVYRSSSFQTTFGSPLTQVASPPSALGPVTTFTDAGLAPSTTYYYVVQAVYGLVPSGAASNTSPNSNHASVTTNTPASGPPPVTTGVMAFDANVVLPNTGQTLGIYFIAPQSGPVELDIYNISGNPIRALYATAVAGTQVNLSWDAKDRNGRTVASGLYLIEIKGPGIHLVRKVIVVK